MKRTSWILLAGLFMTMQAHAAFRQNARRYVHPRDLFNLTAQKFPVVNDREKVNKGFLDLNCYAIVNSNQNVIGAVNPALGVAAVELPPPGFVRWLGTCGHKIISLQIEDMFNQSKNDKLWSRYWPADLIAKYRDPSNRANPYAAFLKVKWSELDPGLQQSLLAFTVHEMIGPEKVIRDLGYAKNTAEVTADLAKAVKGDSVLKDALHDILLATMLREEFLTY